MGITQDLKVAARRWASARHAAPPLAVGEAERGDLRTWFATAFADPGPEALLAANLFDVEATDLPWIDTGIDLDEGQWVTTVAAGRVVLSAPLDLWVGPQFQLWMRVGENGHIFNGARNTHSFCAGMGGRLYLANYFPGQWGDRTGRVSTSLAEYRKYRGGISVGVLRWKSDAATGLASLRGRSAFERLEAEGAGGFEDTPPPLGWDYLWFLGRSEIFADAMHDDRRCISCDTNGNVGILQHEAAFDLTPNTRLRWNWKVDELPSVLPENSMASHDYLSVAVEFENGRDITYTWSPELPVGTGYWCPLATWKDREFHVVIRSGGEGLGTWLTEERNIFADYQHYIGAPPRRIVRIWLIAASIFQRRRGRVLYRDFSLEDGSLEDGSDGRRLVVGET